MTLPTKGTGRRFRPVELALREAMNNAMLHGNRMDARKLVHVRCCCDSTRGVFLAVRDQGHGFDPNTVLRPLAAENLLAEHGRGIYLMKWAMDQVSFERRGTEVHIRKKSGNQHKAVPQPVQKQVVRRRVRRLWPGVRTVESG
jgi:anti-sigma regulatory factor (Ser/Thr protein kinase)